MTADVYFRARRLGHANLPVDDPQRSQAFCNEVCGLAEEFWWYRALRRYGSVPHAGFGLSFERLISYVTRMANVRDVTPVPRPMRNAAFGAADDDGFTVTGEIDCR